MNYFIKASITLLLILVWKNSHPQTNVSARASGMSGICISLSDVQCTLNNPALNTSIESPSVATNAARYYNIAELNSISVSVLFPINKTHAVAFHLFRSGSKEFYDQDLALSYGIFLSQKIKVGVQIERKGKYYQAESQQSITAWTTTIGLASMPLSWLVLAASISNPGGVKWNNQQQTILPGIIRIGTKINFSKNTQLYSQFNKSSSQSGSFHTGFEYSPAPKIQLRTGISTKPVKPAFGIGIILKNTQIDFAVVNHYALGMSPEISIQYKFKR